MPAVTASTVACAAAEPIVFCFCSFYTYAGTGHHSADMLNGSIVSSSALVLLQSAVQTTQPDPLIPTVNSGS